MTLRDQVRDYYFANLDDLSQETRFHFSNRLAAWEGNKRALTYLKSCRGLYLPNEAGTPAIAHSLEELLRNPPSAVINASSERAPYMSKYPTLRPLDFVLFRVRHLEVIYGVDAREALQSVMPLPELLGLQHQLLQDPEAIKFLSTYAVNFMYLLQRVVLKNDAESAIPLTFLYDLADGYNLDDPAQLTLFIYLYTHCIIGESNFYARALPAPLLPIYRAMIKRLEEVIGNNFEAISLDSKLEFLVCARIVGYESWLNDRINDECERSVSDDGCFLVDRHNTRAHGSKKTSFGNSEHRNVLFIMGGSPYRPHNIREALAK